MADGGYTYSFFTSIHASYRVPVGARCRGQIILETAYFLVIIEAWNHLPTPAKLFSFWVLGHTQFDS